MRAPVRILTAGVAAALMALALLGSGVAQAATPHGLTVPARVSASNWTTMPNPTAATATNTDAAVSCVTSAFCMAVGNGDQPLNGATVAEEWNGSVWSSLPMPSVPNATAPYLNGVSCVTTNFCVAVGAADFAGTFAPLIEQWNGSVWSVVQAAADSSDSRLLSVSCTSTTFCMATGPNGNNPSVDAWNGSTWTPTTLSFPSVFSSVHLDGVSCTTPSSCMIVGWAVADARYAFAEHWNGSSWTGTNPVNNPPTNYYFNSVSCAGTSFCTAVGSSGGANLVWTWNGGSTWTNASVPSPAGGGSLNAISCFSATSCTAVGGAGPGYTNTQTLTWDGQTWTEVATPPNPTGTAGSEFFGVDCLTNWACVAAGGAIILGGPTFVPFEAMAPITRSGYRFVASDGGIFSYGAPFLGSTGGMALNKPIVGMAVMPAGDGYYLVASDGGIFNYGSAQFYGSMGGQHLNKPIVGMAVTGDGGGYWLVASDGGIFSFGDAQFYGSTGSLTLNKPIVGMATTPNGFGYYLVASDGGIFNYGNAAFEGSAGSLVLNKPVVGMSVPVSGGYYLVASDGGIFSYPSTLPFYGSTGSITLNKPVVGMAAVAGGYYFVAADGGIFAYPSTLPFLGSRGGQPLNAPIVGMGA